MGLYLLVMRRFWFLVIIFCKVFVGQKVLFCLWVFGNRKVISGWERCRGRVYFSTKRSFLRVVVVQKQRRFGQDVECRFQKVCEQRLQGDLWECGLEGLVVGRKDLVVQLFFNGFLQSFRGFVQFFGGCFDEWQRVVKWIGLFFFLELFYFWDLEIDWLGFSIFQIWDFGLDF